MGCNNSVCYRLESDTYPICLPYLLFPWLGGSINTHVCFILRCRKLSMKTRVEVSFVVQGLNCGALMVLQEIPW